VRGSSTSTPAASLRPWSPLLPAAALLAAVLAISLAQLARGEVSVVVRGGQWLFWRAGDDSWGPMRAAFDWLSRPHAGGVYQEIFFHRHIKFQYPPSSLLVFSALEALGLSPSNGLLNAISWVSILVEASAVGALAYAALRKACPERLRLAAALLAAAMTLCFYPTITSYNIGQIQTWINALFAVAALCWLRDRPGAAGALIGLICLMKPQFGLFLIWGALRREWRFCTTLLAVAAGGNLLAVLRFGWENEIDYLSAVRFMGRHGEAYFPNQSINGVMHRLIGTADPLHFEAHAFAPFNPIVYGTTVATSLLLLAACLWPRRSGGGVADFMIAALTFTIASPIAWEHHYGILPPLIALLAASLVARPAKAEAVVLGAAYLLTAPALNAPDRLGGGLSSLLISAFFLAAVAILALLYRRRAAVLALPAAAEPA
jgi:hypothetical protein